MKYFLDFMILLIMAVGIFDVICLVVNSIDNAITNRDKRKEISQEVANKYNHIINLCINDTNALKWMLTLESRFSKLIGMKEYMLMEPYEILRLKNNFGWDIGITMDKDKILYFVPYMHKYINAQEKEKDMYLSCYYQYGKNLSSFVHQCEMKAIETQSRKERNNKMYEEINKDFH